MVVGGGEGNECRIRWEVRIKYYWDSAVQPVSEEGSGSSSSPEYLRGNNERMPRGGVCGPCVFACLGKRGWGSGGVLPCRTPPRQTPLPATRGDDFYWTGGLASSALAPAVHDWTPQRRAPRASSRLPSPPCHAQHQTKCSVVRGRESARARVSRS